MSNPDAHHRQLYHRRCVIIDEAMKERAAHAFYLARAEQLHADDPDSMVMETCMDKVLRAALEQPPEPAPQPTKAKT